MAAAAPPVTAAAPPAATLISPVPPPATSSALSLEGRVLSGHRFPVYTLAFSPDGRWLASGSLDRTAKLWDLEHGREVRTFPGTLVFTSLDFRSDGRMLALAASDETEPVSAISLWDSVNPQQLRSLTGYQGRCMCVRFHPDGHLLATTEGGMTADTSGRLPAAGSFAHSNRDCCVRRRSAAHFAVPSRSARMDGTWRRDRGR